jgi:hypothetical protein
VETGNAILAVVLCRKVSSARTALTLLAHQHLGRALLPSRGSVAEQIDGHKSGHHHKVRGLLTSLMHFKGEVFGTGSQVRSSKTLVCIKKVNSS